MAPTDVLWYALNHGLLCRGIPTADPELVIATSPTGVRRLSSALRPTSMSAIAKSYALTTGDWGQNPAGLPFNYYGHVSDLTESGAQAEITLNTWDYEQAVGGSPTFQISYTPGTYTISAGGGGTLLSSLFTGASQRFQSLFTQAAMVAYSSTTHGAGTGSLSLSLVSFDRLSPVVGRGVTLSAYNVANFTIGNAVANLSASYLYDAINGLFYKSGTSNTAQNYASDAPGSMQDLLLREGSLVDADSFTTGSVTHTYSVDIDWAMKWGHNAGLGVGARP